LGEITFKGDYLVLDFSLVALTLFSLVFGDSFCFGDALFLPYGEETYFCLDFGDTFF
jgi:hypothetical protein